MGKLKYPARGKNENKTHSKHNKAVICPSILVVPASAVLHLHHYSCKILGSHSGIAENLKVF